MKRIKKLLLRLACRYAEKQYWAHDADAQLYGVHRKERDAWFGIHEALEFLTSDNAEEAY